VLVSLGRFLTIGATLALLASTAGFAGAVSGRSQPAPSHVVVIVLENREYGEVVGSTEAPFLNLLARNGALATHYYAVAHPSLPNYLALLGGSTFGIADNCTDCMARGPSLASQLSRAGISWRAYMGGLPHRCFAGAAHGSYVKRHNPFMYFPSIAADPDRCAQVVPESRLDADIRRQRLPAFSWLTPDLCDGAHDCELGEADRHLAALVPRILRRLGPHGLLVITFDEGTSDAGCCRQAGGGKVMTALVGPDVRPGTRLSATYDHYSLLAMLEERFGLPRLRHARSAPVLRYK
jgi:acid phosphatase